MALEKIIAIVGPTASGKTAIAKKLFETGKFAIFSVDSRQTYKGLDIGTAKDRSFPQIGIDIIEPGENYSIDQFSEYILPTIDRAIQKGLTPVLVGGSFFWLKSILYSNLLPKVSPNSKLRSELENRSIEDLYHQLKKIDKVSAGRTEGNKRRIVRALEINYQTGKPVEQQKLSPRFETLIIGINSSREVLYKNIDSRLESWIDDGLISEIKWLKQKTSDGFINELGLEYRWFNKYINGELDLDEAMQKSRSSLRRLARNQISWMKQFDDIQTVTSYSEVKKLVDRFLKQ